MAFTEVVIVRHGHARYQAEGVVGGPRGCTGLTGRGQAQARKVAAHLAAEHAREPFAALYHSPLPRARQTAEIISSTLDLSAGMRDNLRDPDYGSADGRLWTDVAASVRGEPEDRIATPIAPGAEAWADYIARATAAIERIVTEHNGQKVMLVAHGETVSAAAYLFCRLPSATRLHAGFTTTETGVTRWARTPLSPLSPHRSVWTCTAHNQTTHLDAGP